MQEITTDNSKVNINLLQENEMLKKEIEALKSNSHWKEINSQVDYPETLKKVYVVCQRTTKSGQVIRYQNLARYIPFKTIPASEFMNDEHDYESDYDEEKDEYFTHEGFYEDQTEADIKWKITETVTHWMPLFELPEIKEG